MRINQLLVPFASYLLRNIKFNKSRKRFAKFVGVFFDNSIAKTAYGFQLTISSKKGHYDEIFIQKK